MNAHLQNVLLFVRGARPWSVVKESYDRIRVVDRVRKARKLLAEAESISRKRRFYSPPFYVELDIAQRMLYAAVKVHKLYPVKNDAYGNRPFPLDERPSHKSVQPTKDR